MSTLLTLLVRTDVWGGPLAGLQHGRQEKKPTVVAAGLCRLL